MRRCWMKKSESTLLALCVHETTLGLAWLNLAAGQFWVLETSADSLVSELERLKPAEILLPDSLDACRPRAMRVQPKHVLSVCPLGSSMSRLLFAFSLANLEPMTFPVSVARACIRRWAQPARCWTTRASRKATNIAHIKTLRVERDDAYLRMDAVTRRNLEISETILGDASPTLLSLLDTCSTNMGSRMLRHWLHHPLRDRAAIQNRLDSVSFLIGEAGSGPYLSVRGCLKRIADIERITARIALKSARPRDLSGLRDSLKRLPEAIAAIAEVAAIAES